MRSVGAAIPGVAVFAAAFAYTLPLRGLLDDHFMHVAWGRQLLAGRVPLRDMVEPGLPLQSALSAAAELVFGYRLLSEALVVSLALAAGAVLVFLLARRASGSLWIGLAAAVLQIAVAPRSYSYPKILVYAAGLALLWAYVDRPSRARAAVVGAAVGIAFYFRHDHGLYLGFLAALSLALRHSHEWRVGARHAAALSTTLAALIVPFLLYVQATRGVGGYVSDLLTFAAREHTQNRFESLPDWPIRTIGDLARRDASGHSGAEIGVRWRSDATEESRREAAARHGLLVPDEGPIESGRYVLTDLTRENSLALIRNPVVEDTAGLDRGTGAVRVSAFRIGSLHVLPSVSGPEEAAVVLLYAYAAIAAGTLIVLRRPFRRASLPGGLERSHIAIAAAAAIVTMWAFLREPLDARIADAAVAPIVLAAWWAGRWWNGSSFAPSTWSVAARTAAALLLLVLVGRCVILVGAVPSRLEALGLTPGTTVASAWATARRHLLTTPPYDAWDRKGTVRHRVVRYVRECTAPEEPLLVLWFAPDIYYYADRPFAGRLGFYMEGYWASEEHERANLARLRLERPLLAITQEGREATDLYTYPSLLRYLASSYTDIGSARETDGTIIRVLARNDRTPVSTDPELAWPCYR